MCFSVQFGMDAVCVSVHNSGWMLCVFQRKIREEWQERERRDREEQEKREKVQAERREKQVNWVTLFLWRQMMRYPVVTCCKGLFCTTVIISMLC